MGILNNFGMVPIALRGQVVDQDRPYDIFEINNLEPSRQNVEALLVASDRHYRVVPTDHFTCRSDYVYEKLKARMPVEYLRGDKQVRNSIKEEICRLATKRNTIKLFVYLGHCNRNVAGTVAMTPFIDDSEFRNIIREDGSLWINMLGTCYSGLFARNLAQRPNTVAMSSNTPRSVSSGSYLFTTVIDGWLEGRSLRQAFVYAASRENVSHVAKQLYSNGVDTSKLYF